MKNIFKIIKDYKQKINILEAQNQRLERENNEGYLKLQGYYEACLEKQKELLKQDYNTTIKRKAEVEKITKLYEDRLKKYLKEPIFDISLQEDIDNYLKLLNYLKEN